MKTLSIAFAALLAGVAAAPLATAEPSRMETTAAAATAETAGSFANAVAVTNMYEIEAANIAWERSKNDEVKTFAKALIADHEASAAKLKTIVDQKGGSLPESLDEGARANIDALNDAGDATFDKTFLDQQVVAHEQALKMVKRYAANGADAELKAFAAETATSLEKHLAEARRLGGADVLAN